jgi:hypothetical protein
VRDSEDRQPLLVQRDHRVEALAGLRLGRRCARQRGNCEDAKSMNYTHEESSALNWDGEYAAVSAGHLKISSSCARRSSDHL